MKNTIVFNYFKQLLTQFDAHVPEEDLKQFSELYTAKSLKKGDHLVEFDDRNSCFGIIHKGLIRFYFNTFEGKELNQTFKKENDIFMNYYPHFSGKGSAFAIECLEDTEVYIVNYGDIVSFYDKSPGWNKLGRRLAEENFMIKAERERELLTMDSTERYDSFVKKFPNLLNRLSKHHIALYLGINPASLSRLIKNKS